MKKYLVKEFGFQKSKLLHCTIDRVYNSNLCRIREFMSKHKLFEDIDIEKYKVLISSTSFTPDEDFNILLDALKNYENTPNTPPILLIVTGKGPLKGKFLETVDKLEFTNKVCVKSAWLSSEDYLKY